VSFDQNIRRKVLLWSDRHCCLCKKACGINIEVHHLVPEEQGGSNKIDNAIPLCFDCHGQVQHYNVRHPRGTKFPIEELKARRDQVYEEFTRHLVPPVHVQITQALPSGGKRKLPDVGCHVGHLGTSLPVKARVTLLPMRGREHYKIKRHHLSGSKLISLNPRFTVYDHFALPKECQNGRAKLSVEVSLCIIDQCDREHYMLPVHFVFKKAWGDWYLQPF